MHSHTHKRRITPPPPLPPPQKDCVTELPRAHVELEARVDKVRALYDAMLRLSRNFTATDYDPSLGESVKDAVGKFNELVVKPAQWQLGSVVAGQAAGTTTPSTATTTTTTPATTEEIIPKTFAHALARASSTAALQLGENEPLGGW